MQYATIQRKWLHSYMHRDGRSYNHFLRLKGVIAKGLKVLFGQVKDLAKKPYKGDQLFCLTDEQLHSA